MNNTTILNSYTIRPISENEIGLLKEFLYLAIFIPPGEDPFPRKLLEAPMISKAYKKWGRYGDIALVIEDTKIKEIIGAAWVRLFKKSDPSYGFVDENTPDLVISVKPKYRNKGIGTQLLKTLIQTVKEDGFNAISISVDERNPALRLYKRLGSEIIKHEEGESPVLLLQI